MAKVIKATIQLHRGLAATWAAHNPTLAYGEPGFEKDTYRLKIGDGVTDWNNLAYFNADNIYYDTQENWDRQIDLIAERSAIYIYSNHSYINDENDNRIPIPAIKIGDGTSYLIDMPFMGADILGSLSNHINNQTIHVSNEDRVFWNNKVTSFVDENNPETLILTKNSY